MSQYNQNDGLELRQIVLGHIKRILELSTHELKDNSYSTVTSYSTSVVTKEDSRWSYIQAIENLSYVLLPFFDNEMTSTFGECIGIINAFKFEIRDKLKTQYEEISKSVGKDDLGDDFYIKMQMRYAKKLFRGMNLLLHRNDYLKTSIYGESSSEDLVEDFENFEDKS